MQALLVRAHETDTNVWYPVATSQPLASAVRGQRRGIKAHHRLHRRNPNIWSEMCMMAVTFQTANGQAIAQRDEIDEYGPAIRPINRSQTGRQSIVFHLLGLLLSVCRVLNDTESSEQDNLNPEVNDFNDSTLSEESCCATTSRCKC
jgi:hypothetical protein